MKKKAVLDSLFSKFIRIRDDWTCRKCGFRHKPWNKKYDPAHMKGRWKETLRWDEKNVFGFCRRCHDWVDGHSKQKEVWYVSQFGQDAWDDLVKKDRVLSHFKEYEIDQLITFYSDALQNPQPANQPG